MKPIVGEIDYKELSPEEIARFTREAEEMRAQAMRDMFVAMFRSIGHAVVRAGHGFRNVAANPAIHPSARTH